MENSAQRFHFRVVHLGINCGDDKKAGDLAQLFQRMFGFPAVENPASFFSSAEIELMKSEGRGKNGHIAVATDDVEGAQKYLSGMGLSFDEDSKKYDENGELRLIYLKGDFGGFAVHLLKAQPQAK